MIHRLSQGYITQLDGLSTGGFVVIAVDGVTETQIQVSGNHNLAAPPFRMVSLDIPSHDTKHGETWET